MIAASQSLRWKRNTLTCHGFHVFTCLWITSLPRATELCSSSTDHSSHAIGLWCTDTHYSMIGVMEMLWESCCAKSFFSATSPKRGGRVSSPDDTPSSHVDINSPGCYDVNLGMTTIGVVSSHRYSQRNVTVRPMLGRLAGVGSSLYRGERGNGTRARTCSVMARTRRGRVQIGNMRIRCSYGGWATVPWVL